MAESHEAENNEINEADINEINEVEINEKATSLRNELNLDGAMGKCFNWTPLHVAASSGKEVLFRRLLKSSPELAEPLDSQQRTLLHFASANGYIEIVKAVTKERPEMCLARDRDGANPLHVAAMRGKVEVLDQLHQANPHAARAYRNDRGERETILHLCVKYNQLPFLKILLEKCGNEFVNAKDNDGNTILHLAVAGRRFEIIKHVLDHTEIDVNATNASKQTALDILCLGQEKGRKPKKVFHHTKIDVNATNACKPTALDILCLGRKKGTKPEGVDKRIQDLLIKTYHAERADNAAEIGEENNQIIVAAVLLATLAFQAGVAPPGGVWQDDLDGHKSGKSVMASNHPLLYVFFLWFNTSGFISSLCTLIFIMTDWPFEPRTYSLWKSVTKIITIASIAMAYFISIFMVSPLQKHDRRTVLSRFGHIEGIIVLVLAAYFILALITITATNERIRRHIEGFIKIIRRWTC